jgi:hypothetical protein
VKAVLHKPTGLMWEDSSLKSRVSKFKVPARTPNYLHRSPSFNSTMAREC